ncbi:MAG: response regulator [Candidatus Anammoxibacter sp.]
MAKQVLVIDDNDMVRDAFTLALKGTEYAVDLAANGKDGIEMYKKSKHDLIFLDLKMPEMDGTTVLREIRKISEKVPVYIVTAFYAEFLDTLKDIRENNIAFELLKKPVSNAQILLVTEGVLGK